MHGGATAARQPTAGAGPAGRRLASLHGEFVVSDGSGGYTHDVTQTGTVDRDHAVVDRRAKRRRLHPDLRVPTTAGVRKPSLAAERHGHRRRPPATGPTVTLNQHRRRADRTGIDQRRRRRLRPEASGGSAVTSGAATDVSSFGRRLRLVVVSPSVISTGSETMVVEPLSSLSTTVNVAHCDDRARADSRRRKLELLRIHL